MSKVTKQESERDISKRIGVIRRTGTAYNGRVHECAMLILRHAEAYGDCGDAERLVAAMPKSMRRGLVCTWFARYSPINVRPVKKGGTDGIKASYRTKESKHYNAFNAKGAELNPWFDMPEAQREPEMLDIEDLDKLITRVIKRVEKAVEEDRVVNADLPAVNTTIEALRKAMKNVPVPMVTKIANEQAIDDDTPQLARKAA